jgi:glycosyltransferase involved in cell wall biosynthesis
MPARIYYDVTDILDFARSNATLTGIQRVSLQLLNHIVNRYSTDCLRLIGWHPTRRCILSFDASYFGGDYKYDQEHFCQHFGLEQITTNRTDLRSYLKRKYGRGWKRPIHFVRLFLANTFTSGRTFERRKIASSRKKHPMSRRANEGVSFAPGDLVFIAGANWHFFEFVLALAEERHRHRITVCQFVHDLVPLVAPEHAFEGDGEQYGRWLKHLSANADHLLTNSQATRCDLDAWLAENGADVPTTVLPLAHQFAGTARELSSDAERAAGAIRSAVLNAARLPYVLCVGTIESRKNVWTLANVWNRIYRQLGESTPRLLFAGKQGWLKDDFDDFIRGTGSLYGYIRIVDRPNDDELAYLYRKCLFSVYPSYKEGWGLPVGESLWFGRPVVCSNTSSMPEAGGQWADYIDPTSWQSIETAVMKMITDPAYREKRAAEIAKATLRSWSDVADELWQLLTALGRRQPSARNAS